MSGECSVRFLPSGREAFVPAGTYLTTAAVRAGVEIIHDCDGQGVCSTCRVQVVEGSDAVGPPDARERHQLGAAIASGWRLCCLVVLSGDCVVRVPAGDFPYPPELQRGD